jgi:hypothetical protein
MEEKFTQKLLVEGNDDLHVVFALCKKFNVNENFDIINMDGIGNLESHIKLRVKQSDIRTLGIVIDADTEIRNRWKQLIGDFKTNNN